MRNETLWHLPSCGRNFGNRSAVTISPGVKMRALRVAKL